MSAQISYVKARDVEEARSIIADAASIADDTTESATRWEIVFRCAVELLAAGSIIQAAPSMAFAPPDLLRR